MIVVVWSSAALADAVNALGTRPAKAQRRDDSCERVEFIPTRKCAGESFHRSRTLLSDRPRARRQRLTGIDQKRIDAFATSRDHQWIHVDRTARAPKLPTVDNCPGFLTLSLIPPSARPTTRRNAKMVSIWLNRVRFLRRFRRSASAFDRSSSTPRR